MTYAFRVGRFRIPFDGSAYGELDAALDPNEHGKGMDMCSINPAFLGKKYRYAYACGAERPCNFPNTLTKVIGTALATSISQKLSLVGTQLILTEVNILT